MRENIELTNYCEDDDEEEEGRKENQERIEHLLCPIYLLIIIINNSIVHTYHLRNHYSLRYYNFIVNISISSCSVSQILEEEKNKQTNQPTIYDDNLQTFIC